MLLETEYLELGSAPADESCAQVGSENYYEQMRAEAVRYIQLLRKRFGEEPPGALFRLKAFPHDFGTYHEVCIVYEIENEEASEYAYAVESNLPANWTDDSPFPVKGWRRRKERLSYKKYLRLNIEFDAATTQETRQELERRIRNLEWDLSSEAKGRAEQWLARRWQLQE
jgi:hypothetical protein